MTQHRNGLLDLPQGLLSTSPVEGGLLSKSPRQVVRNFHNQVNDNYAQMDMQNMPHLSKRLGEVNQINSNQKLSPRALNSMQNWVNRVNESLQSIDLNSQEAQTLMTMKNNYEAQLSNAMQNALREGDSRAIGQWHDSLKRS